MKTQEYVRNTDHSKELQQGVVVEDVLSLDATDTELNQTLDSKITASKAELTKLTNWWAKMEEAENIWKGQQLDEEEMYPWQLPYVDNAIFRSIETIIPIAVSRVAKPQGIPAQPNPKSKKLAADVEKQLEYGFSPRRENMRSKVRMALRHLLLYRLGVIKYYWDKDLGENGDWCFETIRPTKFEAFDHSTSDPTKLDFVVELVTSSYKKVKKQFPGKAAELAQALGIKDDEDKTFTYQEVWFTFVGPDGKPIKAVLWRYKHIILHKMKNPNWDWEGEDVTDEYGMPTTDENGQPTGEKVYHNFLENPEHPYIFLNYLNLGKTIVDDTSLLEQAWPLQRTANKRGMQITEMSDKAQGKLAISTGFISAENAELITEDPKEFLLGAGDVRQGVTHVPGEPPPPALFQDQSLQLQEIDNIMGTHSTTRGERQTNETLGGRMILREADYGRIDDLVQEAVEPTFAKAYQVATHMMKLRYTEAHYARVTGPDGKFDLIEFSRDSIEDGLEVYVLPGSSLPQDKVSKRMEAMELAAGGMIPLDELYERLGWDNPKEVALKLIVFNTNPVMYSQILASGKTFTEAVAMGALQPPVQPGMGPEAAPQEGEAELSEAADVMARVNELMESPEFQNMPPAQQQAIITEARSYQDTAAQVADGAV